MVSCIKHDHTLKFAADGINSKQHENDSLAANLTEQFQTKEVHKNCKHNALRLFLGTVSAWNHFELHPTAQNSCDTSVTENPNQ
eukprot:2447537-Amphidinium_carterae.1